MYDPKTETNEFIADSRGDAVAKACKFYGAEEGDLTINELSETSVSGAGGRVIVVARLTAAPPPQPGRDDERGGRDRGDRGDRGGRERGGRDRDRGGRERGGRDRPDRGGRERGGRDRPDRDRDQDRDRGDRDGGRESGGQRAQAVSEAPSGPSVGTAQGELCEVGQFVLGIVERMDLGPFEIAQAEEEKFIVFQLQGEAAGRLTASESRAGDALQLVANQAAMRIDEDHKRVVVDVEGDRERREAFLERTAGRAAKRARETGRSVALDPMNAKDRRAIHIALREEDGIATMSIGDRGDYRQVVVVPEGAPEYEEARQYADRAANA